MVTQVNARAGLWLDGVQEAANDLRLEVASAFLTSAGAAASTGIASAQGVRPGQGSPLLSTWTSGMSFTLNAGTCWVQGTASGTAGTYTATLDTTTTLVVPNGDPTNPRIDSVIAVISDVGTSSSTTIFKILPGTPAGSPAAPTLPANAVRLANIAVAANASVLSAPNFTDLRPYVVAVGGILPVASSAGTWNGPAGSYLDDLATGRLKRLDGSGNARAPKVAAFAPQMSFINANQTPGNSSTVTSVNITVDGLTEIMITATWGGIRENTPVVGDLVGHGIFMDATQVSGWQYRQDSTSGQTGGGGSYVTYNTPAAGTHTVSWQTSNTVGSTFVLVGALILRVGPVLA
jgi:hypothetical protein